MTTTKSSLSFAMGTLISRISGLVRDQVILSIFGASTILDAFLVAFRIPNLFREMLAEGALGSSFTKVYSQLNVNDRGQAKQLLGDAIYLCLVMVGMTTVIGILTAPWLVDAMTGFSNHSPAQALHRPAIALTKILFPYLGLAMLGAVISGALYDKGRFFFSAIAPLSFNLCYIFGAVILSRAAQAFAPTTLTQWAGDPRVVGLAIGVLLGGLAQAAWQFRYIIQDLKGYQLAFRLPWTPEIKDVLHLMIPAALAASAGPINLVINTNFAAGVGEGAITWLMVAFRLYQLPIGIFAVAVGVVILPQISRSLKTSQGEISAEVQNQLSQALILVIALLAPCGCLLIGSSHAIVELLFGYGAFTSRDTDMSAAALTAYSWGIFGYGAIKVLSAFYYAVGRTTYALKVALICVVVNFISNLLLVDQLGHIGLAATASITLGANALLLGWGLRRYPLRAFAIRAGKSLLFFGMLMMLGIVLVHWLMQEWVISFDKFFLVLESSPYVPSFISRDKYLALANITVNIGVVSLLFGSGFAFWFKANPLKLIRSLITPKQA